MPQDIFRNERSIHARVLVGLEMHQCLFRDTLMRSRTCQYAGLAPVTVGSKESIGGSGFMGCLSYHTFLHTAYI